MPKAVWNGVVLAEADSTVIVEGNHYFPPESLHREYFAPSDHHTLCFWKGKASYYDVVVDGEVNGNAAWTYPTPKRRARALADHVAFYRQKGLRVLD